MKVAACKYRIGAPADFAAFADRHVATGRSPAADLLESGPARGLLPHDRARGGL